MKGEVFVTLRDPLVIKWIFVLFQHLLEIGVNYNYKKIAYINI
jgi:hypothetical protein